MVFSGKIKSHAAARLIARHWVPKFQSFVAIPTPFATIRNCSLLFALFVLFAFRFSLFGTIRYSRLFAIRYSGFPDTRIEPPLRCSKFFQKVAQQLPQKSKSCSKICKIVSYFLQENVNYLTKEPFITDS